MRADRTSRREGGYEAGGGRRSAGRERRAAPALLAVGLAAGCALRAGSSSRPSGDERVRSGETLFGRHCASCHGMKGRGDGPMANLLEEEPADLARIAARRDGVFPEPAIRRTLDGRDPVVAHGSREMPVWGRRFGEGLEGDPAGETARRGPAWLLIEYLKSIQRPGPAAPPEA